MITMVQPINAGNALRLFLEPPTGAVTWRILRKGSDSFTTHDDDTAYLAYEGNDKVVVDSRYLKNEQMAFYRPFYFDGTSWTAGATNWGTPAAIYEDHATDVLSFMRERLEAGLLEEVKRGNLSNELGYIQVYTAPPSLEQGLRFPLVTITLDSETPAERGVGEDIIGDDFYAAEDEWFDSEGWLAQVQLQIVGWSLNSDERIELRKAIRRLVVANLSIFDAEGMVQVSLTQQDLDATSGEYTINLYQVMNSFSCLAPVRVGGPVSPIKDTITRSTNG